MKNILFIIPFILLSCVSQVNVAGNYKDVSKFQTGTNYTAEIGNPVIYNEEGYFIPAIIIKKTPTLKSTKVRSNVTANSIYINKMSTAGKDLYYPIGSTSQGIAIDKKTKEAKLFSYIPDYWEFTEPLEYEDYIYPEPGKTASRREFIYNGKSGNTIKFTYREFAGDYARAAYTQDVQYDLNDSNIIGFKGARIQILEATNYAVKYIINQDFDK